MALGHELTLTFHPSLSYPHSPALLTCPHLQPRRLVVLHTKDPKYHCMLRTLEWGNWVILGINFFKNKKNILYISWFFLLIFEPILFLFLLPVFTLPILLRHRTNKMYSSSGRWLLWHSFHRTLLAIRLYFPRLDP